MEGSQRSKYANFALLKKQNKKLSIVHHDGKLKEVLVTSDLSSSYTNNS